MIAALSHQIKHFVAFGELFTNLDKLLYQHYDIRLSDYLDFKQKSTCDVKLTISGEGRTIWHCEISKDLVGELLGYLSGIKLREEHSFHKRQDSAIEKSFKTVINRMPFHRGHGGGAMLQICWLSEWHEGQVSCTFIEKHN